MSRDTGVMERECRGPFPWSVGVALLVAIMVLGCSRAEAGGPLDRSGLPDERSAGEGDSVPPRGDSPAVVLRAQLGAVATHTSTVGPPIGHPLESIDRDAGVSAELSDGSVVWFFGDSAAYYPNGALKYFEIGTAAWAPASEPTVTIDHSVRSRPLPLAEPTADFPVCERPSDEPGMWPLAAAVEHVARRDRVLVWMGNVCLGSNRSAVNQGVSVGEWWYDPDDPRVDTPVQLTVLDQNLFVPGATRFGDAVLPDGNGSAYVYGCEYADDPADPVGGPCHVARVELDAAQDRDAYQIWNGEEWVTDGEPATVDFDAADGAGQPRGPFSVTHEPDSGAVVMVYSPWPSYTDHLEVRVAADPVGPFGPPTQVLLPGCDDTLDGQPRHCYAANVQAFLSKPGVLGLGWYDQMVESGSPRGSFVVSSAPMVVVEE